MIECSNFFFFIVAATRACAMTDSI